VRVCLKMAMNIWHYVVVFHADRTSFLHSYLSSTLYIITTRAVHLVIILEYGKQEFEHYLL